MWCWTSYSFTSASRYPVHSSWCLQIPDKHILALWLVKLTVLYLGSRSQIDDQVPVYRVGWHKNDFIHPVILSWSNKRPDYSSLSCQLWTITFIHFLFNIIIKRFSLNESRLLMSRTADQLFCNGYRFCITPKMQSQIMWKMWSFLSSDGSFS